MAVARKKMQFSPYLLGIALNIVIIASPAYAVANTNNTLATQIASAKSTLAEGTRAANSLSTASVCLEKKSKAMFAERQNLEQTLAPALKARQSLEDAKTPLEADYNIKQKSLEEAQKKSDDLSEAYSKANKHLADLNTLWQRCQDVPKLLHIFTSQACAAGALISEAAHVAEKIEIDILRNNEIIKDLESKTASAKADLNAAQSKIDRNQETINDQNKIITNTGNRIKFISDNRGKIETLALSIREEATALSGKITYAENINFSDNRVSRLSRELSEIQKQLNLSLENQRNIFSKGDSILSPSWRNECKI
ncbi:Chromosome partition protein Smc [compost metagenome]